MDIRALRYFTEVVQYNGFSRAAEALFVTQPAISRSIQKLEHELGFPLLVRDTGGVTLTDEGAILYEHARRILVQFQCMNKALQDKSDRHTECGITAGYRLDLVCRDHHGVYVPPSAGGTEDFRTGHETDGRSDDRRYGGNRCGDAAV